MLVLDGDGDTGRLSFVRHRLHEVDEPLGGVFSFDPEVGRHRDLVFVVVNDSRMQYDDLPIYLLKQFQIAQEFFTGAVADPVVASCGCGIVFEVEVEADAIASGGQHVRPVEARQAVGRVTFAMQLDRSEIVAISHIYGLADRPQSEGTGNQCELYGHVPRRLTLAAMPTTPAVTGKRGTMCFSQARTSHSHTRS